MILYCEKPKVRSLSIGDVRIRLSDGQLVEVVETDPLQVVPYSAMKGPLRHAEGVQHHPERMKACQESDFRDVTDDDLRGDA